MSLGETSAAAPGRQLVRLSTSSGSIEITAELRDDLEITSKRGVERRPSVAEDAIDVPRSGSVQLRCPTGCDLVVGTSSGSVRLVGELGDVRITTHSGSMSVEEVASADLRTTSGSVDVRRCAGAVRATTKSGSVRVQEAGDADLSGVSGTMHVTAGTAQVRTVSGTVKLAVRGDASVQTVSGSVAVSLPAGVHPRIEARGMKRPRVEVDQGDDCVVSVRTVSGSVVVRAR
jgi:DUF4097 and DUF4098 domain-containing protein YvlB